VIGIVIAAATNNVIKLGIAAAIGRKQLAQAVAGPMLLSLLAVARLPRDVRRRRPRLTGDTGTASKTAPTIRPGLSSISTPLWAVQISRQILPTCWLVSW
jgi:hypothetical protein